MNIEALLFDLGGTLIKYENEHSWRELAFLGCQSAAPFVEGATGVKITPESLAAGLLETIDKTMNSNKDDLAEIRIYDLVASVLTDLGIKDTDGLPEKFVEIYYGPTTNQIVLEQGADQVLSTAVKRGMKIGLVSNSIFPASYHRDEMKRYGIFDYFDFTLFSSEEGIRKPNPEIYSKALMLAAVDPKRALFIGDRMPEDIAGPQEMGIKAILKFDPRRDYSMGAEPYRKIDKLEELIEIISE